LSALGVNTPYGPTGDIRATGEITAYYSDRRLKNNVKVIENALDKLQTLTGITYTHNELAASFGYDTRNRIVGVFADELEAILPEAVKLAPFDTEYVEDENGNRVEKSKSGENFRTVQYEKIVPLLIEAVKELKAEVERLKEKVG
jgi:hypothetical protein